MTMLTVKQYPKKRGFVALLDILGTSEKDIEGSRKILLLRDTLLSLTEFEKTILGFEKPVGETPNIVTFADSMGFSWTVQDKDVRYLFGFVKWLRRVIRLGFLSGVADTAERVG